MLFIPDAERDRLAEMLAPARTGDAETIARRVIEYRPTSALAWAVLGASVNDPVEAEAALRKALWLEPCRANNYLSVAAFLTERDEGNVEAKHLRTLALWKISMAEKVPVHVGERFEPSLGADAWQPEVYEFMAINQESEFKKAGTDPELAAKLRPYRLLNSLQRVSHEGFEEPTLEAILQHRDECEPLFRNALREWARTDVAMDDDCFHLLVAILGEISGADAVDEVLELIDWNGHETFLHVQWAIHRLFLRHPKEVLARFQAAAGSSLHTRCTIAENVLAVPPLEGDAELLEALFDGYDSLPDDIDGPGLVAAVVAALRIRDREPEATALAARYGAQFTEEDRRLANRALQGRYVPMLVEMEIAARRIDEICLDGVFLRDEEGEDEELTEDELQEEVDVAPPARPERNEPCWCGSGKKYKKCHLLADEEADRRQAELEEEENGQPMTHQAALMLDVLKASSEWHRESDIRRAKKYFFGEGGNVEADETEIDAFVQWLLHDFRDAATRRTALENFLRTRGSRLNEADRELLESLRDARFGVYEVERVEPGSGIELHDLFVDDRMFVHDITSSNNMQRWDCILARLQHHEGRWVLAGNGTMVPRQMLDQIRNFVERGSRGAKQSPVDFVRANSHQLRREVKEWHARKLAGLRIVNNEGEEVSFGKAEYEISDVPALLAKLRSIPELEGPSGGTSFTWLQPMGGERRPLGDLAIENGLLRLEAMSRTRLETLRGLAEFHASALLKHRGDHYTSVDEIKEKVRRGQSAPPQLPISDEERRIVEQALCEHYRGWVDENLPALGNKTAREAMRTDTGRAAVIELLRVMDNQERHKLAKGIPVFDFNIIRRELGLPEE